MATWRIEPVVVDCFRSVATQLQTNGSLKTEEISHKVLLFSLIELQFENNVEELDGVVKGRTTTVVQVRRRILDASQRKRLDRPLRTASVEAFHL